MSDTVYVSKAEYHGMLRTEEKLKQAERERDAALDSLLTVWKHGRVICDEFGCRCFDEAEAILRRGGRIK